MSTPSRYDQSGSDVSVAVHVAPPSAVQTACAPLTSYETCLLPTAMACVASTASTLSKLLSNGLNVVQVSAPSAVEAMPVPAKKP